MTCNISKKFLLAFGLILGLAIFLRVYALEKNPPGLYWEEVALGYDAYAIWQTGRDHHGQSFPLVAFKSFGDWKPSLYFYATVPFVASLGLTATAVRLPSAVAGVLIVLAIAQLAKISWQQIKSLKNKIPPNLVYLVALLVAAVNPWALHFSRGAWEANLATALISWAVVFICQYWQQLKQNAQALPNQFILGSWLLILAMYSYHAARLAAPLLGLTVLIMTADQLKPDKQLKAYFKTHRWRLLSFIIISGLLLFPLARSLTTQSVTNRFTETSLFSNLEIIEKSNTLKAAQNNSVWSRLFYHRYWLFGKEIISNFLAHFNLNFLFVAGDLNPRHSIQYFGHLYYFELIFLALGVFYLIKYFHKNSLMFSVWLVAGILPASLTKTTPHALRILIVMPVFVILISLGLSYLLTLAKKSWLKISLITAFIGLYGLFFAWYWHFYWYVYPQKYQAHWQAGYQPMIQAISALEKKYPKKAVYITRAEGRPAMYYWFYQQTDPRQVQKAALSAKKDQGEFLEFGQVKFIDSLADIKAKHYILATTQEKPDLTPESFIKPWYIYLE